MPLTLKFLTDHMKKYNDTVILIGKNQINYFEEQENITSKVMRREKDKFWTSYDKYKENVISSINKDLCTTMIDFFTHIKTSAVIEFDTSSVYSVANNINEDITYIPYYGVFSEFSCQNPSCQEDIYVTKDYTCKCGRDYRPDILLSGEKYNIDIINEVREIVQNCHTLILIDMDYKEKEIINLLEIFNNERQMIKGSDQAKVLVTLQDPSIDFDVNEVAFSDFVVIDNPRDSVNRLIEGYLE